eukprot:TRINITY_DN725_c1_g3_i2.p1 TRINITY_DN725_c1_g3~~TRINITY_DN725_c1_g3_i2.p1  ORF type:complete len:290 (+),score=29.33 TRINITY_DN725_c1_g3_i2:106-975(+)
MSTNHINLHDLVKAKKIKSGDPVYFVIDGKNYRANIVQNKDDYLFQWSENGEPIETEKPGTLIRKVIERMDPKNLKITHGRSWQCIRNSSGESLYSLKKQVISEKLKDFQIQSISAPDSSGKVEVELSTEVNETELVDAFKQLNLSIKKIHVSPSRGKLQGATSNVSCVETQLDHLGTVCFYVKKQDDLFAVTCGHVVDGYDSLFVSINEPRKYPPLHFKNLGISIAYLKTDLQLTTLPRNGNEDVAYLKADQQLTTTLVHQIKEDKEFQGEGEGGESKRSGTSDIRLC